MKKYILLSLLLLAAGVFCCLDMRLIKLFKLIRFDDGKYSEYYDKMPDNENDKKLVDGYFHDDITYQELQKIRPDDYVWLVQLAWMNDFKDPHFAEIVAKLRKVEPQNGCTDYLEAAFYARKAVDHKYNGKSREYKVIDRKALEKSMFFYQQALQKPYVKMYSFDRPAQIVSLLQLRDDPVGTVQRVGIYAKALLPNIPHLRFLASAVVCYAELLDKEGRKDESRRILSSGRDFVLQWARHNSETLIENLVYNAVVVIFHESAQKLNDKELTAFYGNVVNDLIEWKQKEDNSGKTAVRYGGIFGAMLLPALKVDVKPEIFAPERYLTYLVFDRGQLMIFAGCCVLTVILLLLAALIGKLCGQEVRLVKFSRRAWMNIILIGVILPPVIFLLFSRIDALGGRNMSMYFNKTGFIIGSALLILMGAWLITVLRIEIRQAGKINFASHCLSKVLPFALLLLLAGVFLGTYFRIEEKYYFAKDTLFRNSRGFSNIESMVTKQRTDKLISLLEKK